MTDKRTFATDSPRPPRRKREPFHKRIQPTKEGWISAVPIGILAVYTTLIAPDLIPLPRSLNVPFPTATRFLESACKWCGENPWHVLGIGAALLLPGILFRFMARRYYLWLTIIMTLTLGFTYISISAPIDRLFNEVEAKLNGYDRDYGIPRGR